MEDSLSYIDYEAFLGPSFSPHAFANTLIRNTNNSSDTPLDLATPLSKVLFDLQEIDTHIHALATRSALPLLSYTATSTAAATRIVDELTSHLSALNETYSRLEADILKRHDAANQASQAAQRLWLTARLGRELARALALGRQLEIHMTEVHDVGPASSTKAGTAATRKQDPGALIRAASTVVALQATLNPFPSSVASVERQQLKKLDAIRSLQSLILNPAESQITARAQQIIRDYSTVFASAFSSSESSLSRVEDANSRVNAALASLWMLSWRSEAIIGDQKIFKPTLMITAVNGFLLGAVSASTAAMGRGLGNLAHLEQSLSEVSVRCQSTIALQSLLQETKPPPAIADEDTREVPSNEEEAVYNDFLEPVLQSLDAASLASHFWRTLAGALSTKVQELVARGGAQARILKARKEQIREEVKECVIKGSRLPVKARGKGEEEVVIVGHEREIAVMIRSIVGHLGR